MRDFEVSLADGVPQFLNGLVGHLALLAGGETQNLAVCWTVYNALLGVHCEPQ